MIQLKFWTVTVVSIFLLHSEKKNDTHTEFFLDIVILEFEKKMIPIQFVILVGCHIFAINDISSIPITEGSFLLCARRSGRYVSDLFSVNRRTLNSRNLFFFFFSYNNPGSY